jgi:hypothetical protein
MLVEMVKVFGKERQLCIPRIRAVVGDKIIIVLIGVGDIIEMRVLAYPRSDSELLAPELFLRLGR